MLMNLSTRERNVLDFIIQYQNEHKCGPSLQEIADGIGVASRSSSHRYMTSLSSKGWLTVGYGRRRSCMVSQEALQYYERLARVGRINTEAAGRL